MSDTPTTEDRLLQEADLPEVVREVATNEWGITAPIDGIRPVPSMWGLRVTRVTDENGETHLVKKPVTFHPSEKTERACRFSTMVSERLNFYPSMGLGGGVSTLPFAKRSASVKDAAAEFRHVSHVSGWSEQHRTKIMPLRFVCSKFLEGTSDYEGGRKGGMFSRSHARLSLARGMATLHSFAAPSEEAAPAGLAELDPNIGFLGSVSTRLTRVFEAWRRKSSCKFLDKLTDDRHASIIADFKKIESDLGPRIDALPVFPGTGDLQTKNMIGHVGNGVTTVINTEILVRMSRLWDMIYLLVLDDACTGYYPENPDADEKGGFVDTASWVSEFSMAIRVYVAYLTAGATNEETLRFSEEECNLFSQVVRIKKAQLTAMDMPAHAPTAQRCYNFIKAFDQWSPVVTQIMLDARNATLTVPELLCWHPEPKTAKLLEGTFGEHVVRRIVNGNSERKTKCVIYFNGTYAPYHHGHLEAAVQAAKAIEAADKDTEVVGIAISPCRGTYFAKKMQKKNQPGAHLFSDISRAGLIDLALHGTSPIEEAAHSFAAALQHKGFNAFVDTNEALRHDAGDQLRYDSIVKRTQRSVEAANSFLRKSGSDAFAPRACFAIGDDLLEFSFKHAPSNAKLYGWHGLISFAVVSRKLDSVPVVETIRTDSIPSEDGADPSIPMVVTETSTLGVSSSAVREAWNSRDWLRVRELLGLSPTAFWMAIKTETF